MIDLLRPLRLPFKILGSWLSRFAGPVDRNISDSYFYGKSAGDIYYCPIGNWFELGSTKMTADKKSFKPIARDFGKDKDHVYYKDLKILQADLNTFVIADGVIKDRRHVYFERGNDLHLVEGADPATYRHIHEEVSHSKWAKDDFHYYLFNERVAVDHPSFRIFKNSLAADKNFLYKYKYETDNISGWPKTTLEIAEPVQGKIKEVNEAYLIMDHCVYSNFDGYMKNCFDRIDQLKIVDESSIIINATLLIDGKIFGNENVDLPSFEKFKDYRRNGYSKDRNTIYYEGKALANTDINTFEVLGDGYAKDKEHVFYSDFIVDGALPDSFGLDKKNYEWKNGKTVYMNGKPFMKNGKLIN